MWITQHQGKTNCNYLALLRGILGSIKLIEPLEYTHLALIFDYCIFNNYIRYNTDRDSGAASPNSQEGSFQLLFNFFQILFISIYLSFCTNVCCNIVQQFLCSLQQLFYLLCFVI